MIHGAKVSTKIFSEPTIIIIIWVLGVNFPVINLHMRSIYLEKIAGRVMLANSFLSMRLYLVLVYFSFNAEERWVTKINRIQQKKNVFFLLRQKLEGNNRSISLGVYKADVWEKVWRR